MAFAKSGTVFRLACQERHRVNTLERPKVPKIPPQILRVAGFGWRYCISWPTQYSDGMSAGLSPRLYIFSRAITWCYNPGHCRSNKWSPVTLTPHQDETQPSSETPSHVFLTGLTGLLGTTGLHLTWPTQQYTALQLLTIVYRGHFIPTLDRTLIVNFIKHYYS